MTLRNVTVVVVSQRFYDTVIHVDSLLLRGPGWENWFVPKGDMVQVALHHEALPVTADTLHAAVLARWTAFRGADPAHAQSSVPSMPAGQQRG
jgi:hypothetical protein